MILFFITEGGKLLKEWAFWGWEDFFGRWDRGRLGKEGISKESSCLVLEDRGMDAVCV